MKLLTLLTALSAVVLLTGTVAVAVPFDITTADGNGADTYVNDQQPDVNHSADDHMIAWDWLNPGPGVFLWYKMYTRFDLSAIAQPLSSAKLTCTTLDGQFPPGTSIWALDDGDAGEAWVEADITWNNAPANDTAGNGFLSNATYVGDFENINPVAGGTGDFSGAALLNFLNADTDGLATFMILSPGETLDPPNNGFTYLASKENAVLAPPTLTVEEIPEPATLSLIGLGVLGLLRRRRA